MKQWFGSHQTRVEKHQSAGRRLRYATIAFLDETDGDYEYAVDIIELAEHDWGIVNDGE